MCVLTDFGHVEVLEVKYKSSLSGSDSLVGTLLNNFTIL